MSLWGKAAFPEILRFVTANLMIFLYFLAAFGEYKDSGLNTPPSTPTPCLKIRNMFDLDM